MKYISKSIKDTENIAKQIMVVLESRTKDKSVLSEATIVGLSGHLGAGKTAFVKTVADHLGIREDITSPTFVIMKKYPIKDVGGLWPWKHLIHIDAYRLEDGRGLEVLGFERLVANPDNIIFIEWPENISEVFDNLSNKFVIRFDLLEDENSREIVFVSP